MESNHLADPSRAAGTGAVPVDRHSLPPLDPAHRVGRPRTARG
ncbi:hypothetical protein [Streptomyces sp. Act143]|nr:hypothetical protein [Streptomyces sp. Act143]